ncbi:MAG: sigma-70 family RNA polymerase sigma factor [Acidobacteria bacterium]|jgi:RNA polymerase sigma-70 factor (ECF subfamily)|nr:sigma-70 family RNA polymerase sigma factor [Acidobacteriota bacterium]
MSATLCALMVDLPDEPAEIARSLRSRDYDALDVLIERHRHRLLRYLLHLTGEGALAEDLFQETWVRVFERGGQYDGRSPFVPWLLSVARHLAIDHLRRRTSLSFESLGRRVPLTDAQPSPFEHVVAAEGSARLTELMAQLPAIHRELLLLRFQEDLTLSQIATLTGVPLPTVKSRLYRALESARRIWGETT